MTITMTATDFKATVLSVLDQVAQGDEVQITKHGKPVARLVPVSNPKSLWGRFAGVVSSQAEDEELFQTGEIWSVGEDGDQ